MATIKSFNEKEIRAVRGAETEFEEYWVHIELLVNNQWITPYLVHKEKLDWDKPCTIMRPTVKNMQEYAERKLKEINKLLEKGWEMVSYKEYEEVIDRYHFPFKYTPTTVYL